MVSVFLPLLAPLLKQQGKLRLISLRLGAGLKARGKGLRGVEVGSCWPPKGWALPPAG